IARNQELLFARAGPGNVDCGEDALVGDFAVEHDFRVTRALELFEDHFVHAAAGIDQRGGDDGERAAFLDVARGAEEALRPLQRVRVHAAGQNLARRGHDGVVGATQSRDRVEQDNDVALVLDQAFGFLDHHLGDLHVARGRLVEGRGDHFALHRALHVGHFFRPLVDEQHDEVALGVIGRDRMGDVLENDRLAGTRLRHDQTALAFAERGHDVDDASRQIFVGRLFDLHLQPLIRVERRQIVEMDLVALLFGVLEIDGVDLEQRVIALAVFRAPDLAFDGIAGAETEAPDLRRRHVDVVGAGEIVRVGRAEEADAVLENFHDAGAGGLDVARRALLQNREAEILLAHGARVLDLNLFGEAQELRRRFRLQILQLHFLHARLLQRGNGLKWFKFRAGGGAALREGGRKMPRSAGGGRPAPVRVTRSFWEKRAATASRIGCDSPYSRPGRAVK